MSDEQNTLESVVTRQRSEIDTLRVELARANALLNNRDAAELHLLQDAEALARKYGCEPGWLQHRWRQQPAPKFDYQECMAAVLDALNREGIPAWNGDATGCVVQIVEAQAKRADAQLAAQLAEARELLADLLSETGMKECYTLADGTLHPGATSTVKEVWRFLWGEGKQP